ncbi:hypothetical protein [Sulfurirhabdus autotrophica]|uniref:Uncharacterized protein n=1 Tax=Sulfurirhabdus autotrophica TaxID=1706046 RepID=A0A4R3Y123_9PROT|nr:hypothetical protein [Sulfurirhabdus autotrophica]TCV85122.1 hypothetical protein EDC63_11011 [Sulfurirhabdus autotrophica]
MSAGTAGSPSQQGQTLETLDHTLVDAVNAADLLLAYATEQGSNVDEALMATIVHSKHILASRTTLTEDEESAFWYAYRKLCIATAPVSYQSLEATNPRLGVMGNVSDAGKAVLRYQGFTISFIVILLLFQVYWVFLSTLVDDSRRIHKEIIEIQVAANIQEKKDPTSAQQNTQTIENDPKYIDLWHRWQANLALLSKADIVGKFFKGTIEEAAKNAPEDLKLYISKNKDYLEAAQQMQTGAISLTIMSLYILPILYGLIGASAYVLRTLSQQIKTRTFTRASKIRLQLRIVLGALAGFSIAWFVGGDDSVKIAGNTAPLTPLALAFLAGYSIELLFSAMDTLVEAFTQGRAHKPMQLESPNK